MSYLWFWLINQPKLNLLLLFLLCFPPLLSPQLLPLLGGEHDGERGGLDRLTRWLNHDGVLDEGGDLLVPLVGREVELITIRIARE